MSMEEKSPTMPSVMYLKHLKITGEGVDSQGKFDYAYPQLRIRKSHRENKLLYGLSTELYPAACSKAPAISSCCAAGIPIFVAMLRQPDTARAIGTSDSLASLGRK